MKQLTILIIEDDKPSMEILKAAFQDDGHIVYAGGSIGECRKILQQAKADILILDRGLPDGDGLQLCMTLKEDPLFRAIPVLMLTARAEVQDKVLGLRWGADDYLAKPYDLEELLARVSALARRVYGDLTAILTGGGITMDLKARTVTRNNAAIELSNKEFRLLRVFMENPDTALNRDFIITAVWRDARPSEPRVVDVTVGNLRRKLGGEDSPISSVRAFGYKFTSAE